MIKIEWEYGSDSGTLEIENEKYNNQDPNLPAKQLEDFLSKRISAQVYWRLFRLMFDEMIKEKRETKGYEEIYKYCKNIITMESL